LSGCQVVPTSASRVPGGRFRRLAAVHRLQGHLCRRARCRCRHPVGHACPSSSSCSRATAPEARDWSFRKGPASPQVSAASSTCAAQRIGIALCLPFWEASFKSFTCTSSPCSRHAFTPNSRQPSLEGARPQPQGKRKPMLHLATVGRTQPYALLFRQGRLATSRQASRGGLLPRGIDWRR